MSGAPTACKLLRYGWIAIPRHAERSRLYHGMTFDPLAASRRRRPIRARSVALVVSALIALGLVLSAPHGFGAPSIVTMPR